MQTQTVEMFNPEVNSADELPTISCDRAVGHFMSNFELDTDILQSFYNSLPHENKPPLSNLTIHFSATAFTKEIDDDEKFWTSGQMYWKGTKLDKFSTTPEIPETETPTIVVYMGSILSGNSAYDQEDLEYIGTNVSKTITHELTHYAQGRKAHEELSTAEKMKDILRYRAGIVILSPILDKRWAKGGAATVLASEAFTDNSLPASFRLAGGTAVLVHTLGIKKRSKQYSAIAASESLKVYTKDEYEVDARKHERILPGLFSIEIEDIDDTHLNNITIEEEKKRGVRVKQTLARNAHKKLSSKPPAR